MYEQKHDVQLELSMENEFLQKHGATEKYVWPGGYERFAIMDDGGVLCTSCLNNPTNPIHEDTTLRDGWGFRGLDHMGNCDDPLNCDHCGVTIE